MKRLLILALVSIQIFSMDTEGKVIRRNSSAESIEIDLEKGTVKIPISTHDPLSIPPVPSNSATSLNDTYQNTGNSNFKTALITGVTSLLMGGISAAITYFSSHSNNNNSTSCPPYPPQ